MGLDIGKQRSEQKESAEQQKIKQEQQAEKEAKHRAKLAAADRLLGITPSGAKNHNKNPLLCQQCQTPMNQKNRVQSSTALQIVAVFLFLFGVMLLFFFPLGTILGLALMIACARMGYKKEKVWACPQCGYFFNRM